MWIALGIVVFFAVPALLLVEVLRCVYLEFRGDRVPILLYHRLISRKSVEAGETPDNEPVYAAYDDVFADQMRHLAENGHTTLSLDEFRAIRRGEKPLPPKSLVITFDDGYESNYTMAWPAMREHGIKATIFVAPRPDEYTRGLVRGFDGFLSAEQMKELDAGGVAIESHTLTHCVLAELGDDEARHELVESNRVLESMIGRPIRHLAIPRSGYSRRIRNIVREVGYATVCCNNKGSSNGWSNLQALPRIVIERDMSVREFARALEPRTGLTLRLLGNIKRLPEFLFGSSGAQKIRRLLYRGPLAGLFVTRRLKRVIAGCALLYAIGALAFAVHLIAR
jgi:peptidoglycan/xylan/chitin deacetylase (PgdA/CDA1 family)